MTTTSADPARSATAASISAAVLDPHDLGAVGRRQRHGGDEADLGAAGGSLLGEGVALLARRAVAEEADRVERLAGAARGDEHRQAGEVLRGQDGVDGRHDPFGRGEPSGADVTAGEATGLGLDDVHAPALQRRQVLLDRGVLPHLGVHGGAQHDRRPGGEERGREQVGGAARSSGPR